MANLKWKLGQALGVGMAGETLPPKSDRRRDDLDRERPPSISGLIEEVLEQKTQRRVFFRPSMLHGCNRQNVFHYREAPYHPSRQDPRMMRILDNGTKVHEVMQAYLADHPEWWFAPESRVYRRVNGAWIRGSCDGVLIRRSDGYKCGIEIKSMAHAEFMKLTKPKEWHIKQASIYARLQRLHWIVVIYWDKDKQHLKDYPVEYDKKAWLETKSRVKFLKGYIDREELPPFDPSQCDPTFCNYVDYCKKRGGKPEMANKKWMGG